MNNMIPFVYDVPLSETTEGEWQSTALAQIKQLEDGLERYHVRDKCYTYALKNFSFQITIELVSLEETGSVSIDDIGNNIMRNIT